MRHAPLFAETDEAVARALIAANPWATIVSENGGALVASHYPVLLDQDRPDELVVVTHVGRPDDQVHGFGRGTAPDSEDAQSHPEVLMIFAGQHGYISPSWYADEAMPVATWNFSVVHAYGVPEILSAEDNLRVLTRLTDHFERRVDHPTSLDQEVGAKIARGTVGIRVPITRFICKVKMSQNKSPETQGRIIEALERPGGPYADPALASDMRAALDLPAG